MVDFSRNQVSRGEPVVGPLDGWSLVAAQVALMLTYDPVRVPAGETPGGESWQPVVSQSWPVILGRRGTPWSY